MPVHIPGHCPPLAPSWADQKASTDAAGWARLEVLLVRVVRDTIEEAARRCRARYDGDGSAAGIAADECARAVLAMLERG